MAAIRNVYHEVRIEAAELPSEQMQVRELTGKESISKLFTFDIEAVCTDVAPIDATKVIGSDICLVFTLQPEGTELRRMYGMISALDELFETQVQHRTYRLRVVPRAYRLTLVEVQEIFMDLSVPEIIAQKAEKVGIDVEMRLMGTYPKLPFVVQYKETDLAFISRLAEHLGISYFFEHASGADMMIFTDHADRFQPIEGESTVAFRPRGEEVDVYKFELRTQIIPEQYIQYEYNSDMPRLSLTSAYSAPTGYAGGVIEYGSHYKTPEEGQILAQVRAEERQCTRAVYSGMSDVCTLSAGTKFSLDGQSSAPEEMLLIEVEHRATQVVLMEGGKGGERTYTNVFRAIDGAITYRPPRRTPKPRIHGLIPGLIEPQPSGEIGLYAQVDPAGSYTVRFFFDPSTPGSRSLSSLPIRMLQPHAGTNYGMHFPLKPGIEVLVGFVEGDPDRPVIVGAVPNPITPSPVTRSNSIMNRIETASGVFLEIRDI